MAPPDKAGASTLTPDQARAILKRDAANVVKRVTAGKPLSSSERKHLAALVSGGDGADPQFAANAAELADVLGVDRKTVARWKRTKGNPGTRPDGRYSVNEWREFKASRPAGDRDSEDLDEKAEKTRNIRLKNQKLEAEVAVLRRDYVEKALVEQWVGGMIMTAKRVLLGLPSGLAPHVVGLEIPDAERMIREGINQALAQLQADPMAAFEARGGVEEEA